MKENKLKYQLIFIDFNIIIYDIYGIYIFLNYQILITYK